MPKRRKLIAPIDDKAISKRLAEIRKRRGIRQVDLAEKLGINQPLVSQYERGDIRLHGSLVAAFARALRVSSDEILGLKDVKEEPTLLQDRRFLRRLHKLDALSRRDKQALLRTIDRYLGDAADSR